MSTTYTIETAHLRKEYSRKVAVADLDLQVGQGEVFGFLGPNGAGKTTSIKMLLGLAKPTSGEARLLGQPIGDPQSRSRVGFLPEHFRFHDWLNGEEFLHLHAQLYGMGEADRKERVPVLLKRVGLEEHADKKLRGYSKGHVAARRSGAGAVESTGRGVSRRADLGPRSDRAHSGARHHPRTAR